MRRPVAPQGRPQTRLLTLPAPTRGIYVSQSPAATPRDSSGRPLQDTAEVIENWFPTQRGIRVRGGLLAQATTGGNAVVSMWSFTNPTTPRLFAATETAIYDMSSLDPDTAPTADVTGQTAGYYSTQQIGTVGGDFLYAVNGVDAAQLFDGGTWQAVDGSSTPIAITGSADTSTFSDVWLYRSRLFFVQKASLTAWYLPVDSVGGEVSSVSLAGTFQRGGSLLFGASWSLDAGDGIDDKCVFVSTEGEIAVFEGADPSSASDWRLVGRYDSARPLGINAKMQAGGDLVVATVDGIISLQQAVQKDVASLTLNAISRPIEPIWQFEAQNVSEPVEAIKWSENSLGLFVFPGSQRLPTVNLLTGAWGVQTGWNPTCGTVFIDRCFIGTSDGSIYSVDETGADDGVPYTAKYCHAFQNVQNPSSYKRAQFVRPTFYSSGDVSFLASIAEDFSTAFPPAPNADVGTTTAYMTWDVDNWDEDIWWSDSIEQERTGLVTEWTSVAGEGYALAPQIQITSGSGQKPVIELVRIDMGLEIGGGVV